jgi:hypothetical protein
MKPNRLISDIQESLALESYNERKSTGIPTHANRLIAMLHGLDIGDTCANCTAEAWGGNVHRQRRCKGLIIRSTVASTTVACAPLKTTRIAGEHP